MAVDDPEPAETCEQTPVVDSFTDFYEAQYRSVVAVAAALVGRWDVAEELVQDSFMALHARWSRVSRYEAPELWLRRIVLNRADLRAQCRGPLFDEAMPVATPPSSNPCQSSL